MMTRTGLVTTILIITLAIYDLCEVLFSGTGSSVSNFLSNVGIRSQPFVFAIGFISGHLLAGKFTPVPMKKD